jgi:hypothetical protein
VDEIVGQAKSVLNTDFTFEVHTVSDPFTSFAEGRELAKVLARKKGGENIVNLTGGSTALQDAVQSIARLISAKEVAVIDRRPYTQQQANPYVVGEIIEIPEIASEPLRSLSQESGLESSRRRCEKRSNQKAESSKLKAKVF